MWYITAGVSLGVALLCIVILGVAFGYDLVELTFHPPIILKIKLTKSGRRK